MVATRLFGLSVDDYISNYIDFYDPMFSLQEKTDTEDTSDQIEAPDLATQVIRPQIADVDDDDDTGNLVRDFSALSKSEVSDIIEAYTYGPVISGTTKDSVSGGFEGYLTEFTSKENLAGSFVSGIMGAPLVGNIGVSVAKAISGKRKELQIQQMKDGATAFRLNGQLVTRYTDPKTGFTTYNGNTGGLNISQLETMNAFSNGMTRNVYNDYQKELKDSEKDGKPRRAPLKNVVEINVADVLGGRPLTGSSKIYMTEYGTLYKADGSRANLSDAANLNKVLDALNITKDELVVDPDNFFYRSGSNSDAIQLFNDKLTKIGLDPTNLSINSETIKKAQDAQRQTLEDVRIDIAAGQTVRQNFPFTTAGSPFMEDRLVGTSDPSPRDLSPSPATTTPTAPPPVVKDDDDDDDTFNRTTSSGYKGSTVREQQEASDKAMADFFGTSSSSKPDFTTEFDDAPSVVRFRPSDVTYSAASGGFVQKLAPGGGVGNDLQEPETGIIGGAGRQVSDAQSVADNIPMRGENKAYVINQSAMDRMGQADFLKMVADAKKTYKKLGKKAPKTSQRNTTELLVSLGEGYIEPHLVPIIGLDRLEKINARGEADTERKIQQNGQARLGGRLDLPDRVTEGFINRVAPTSMPEEVQATRDRFEYENTADHAVPTIVAGVQEAGLPSEFANALIGNAFGESRFKSRSRQKQRNTRAQRQVDDATTEAYLRSKTGGQGYGLFQFDGVVKEGLIDYLEEQGVNVGNSRELELAAEDARNQVMFILDDAFGRGKTFGPGNAKNLKEAMLNAKTDRERVELLYRNYFRPEPVRKKNEAEIKKNVDKRTNVLGSLNNFLTGREPPPKIYPKRSKSDPSFDEFLQTLPLDRETPSINVMPTPRPLLRDTPSDKSKGFLESFLDMFQR